MHLSYCGAPFHGWQEQTNAASVQSTLQDAMSLLARTPVKVTGAGRTDTGVNARMMVAHFDLPEPLPEGGEDGYVRRLNAMTGRDIAVRSVRRVADNAHARFDATSRTYRYFAVTAKSPFLHRLAWQAPYSLDYDAMNAAAAMMLGRRDFTSFSKLHTDTATNICDLREARWEQESPGLMTFTITADRFLRNMVRAIVGTLAEVGRGKIPPEAVMDIIARKDRCAAGTSMPGHALYIWDITYPYYRPDASEFVTAL